MVGLVTHECLIQLFLNRPFHNSLSFISEHLENGKKLWNIYKLSYWCLYTYIHRRINRPSRLDATPQSPTISEANKNDLLPMSPYQKKHKRQIFRFLKKHYLNLWTSQSNINTYNTETNSSEPKELTEEKKWKGEKR